MFKVRGVFEGSLRASKVRARIERARDKKHRLDYSPEGYVLRSCENRDVMAQWPDLQPGASIAAEATCHDCQKTFEIYL